MMNDEQLHFFNEQGLIPGPDETKEQFLARAHYCLNLRNTIPEGASESESFQKQLLEEAASITTPLYGIAPTWVPVFFSNQKLAPWHGGCAWIFQQDENAPVSSFFQLRAAFKQKSCYLGLYERKELIAHELCHVGRMMFEEPKFEEILAYRTTTGWRRWLGPIVQSSTESMIFVLSLVVVFFGDLFALFIDPTAWESVSWLKILPVILILFALVRLWMRQKQLNQCLEVLKKEFGDRAEAVAFRLTDAEIILFSSTKKFREYSSQQNNFRWEFLQNL